MPLLPKLLQCRALIFALFFFVLEIENVDTNVFWGSLIKPDGDETICPVRFALIG